MAQRRIRPQHALRRDALAGLPHVHADRSTEEVLDLVRVVVECQPAGAAEGNAAHDERGEVHERNAIEAGRVEAGYVLLVADEEDSGDGALELGDGGHGLGDTAVDVRVERAGMVCLLDDVVSVGAVLPLLHEA